MPFPLFEWNWRMFNEKDKMNGFPFSFYISVVHDSNILQLYQYCGPSYGHLEYRDYFMVGERVRFLFTSCGESQTNERVFELVNKKRTRKPTMK